ncbi:MAG: hypothetical protein GY794_19945, partial [bacterium]|nr:hypothetical protein [bacterium]
MIVKMSKVYVVSCAADRQALLDKLADMGAVHLTPVDPSAAIAAEQTVSAIDAFDRAMQILAEIKADGDKPDLSARQAADETLEIQRLSAERNNRLTSLHRQYEQLAPWGEITLQQLTDLRNAGVTLEFFDVATEDSKNISCECFQVAAELSDDRVMVSVANRDSDAELPESLYAWFKLVKLWATLRFDDHRGLLPGSMSLLADGLHGQLVRTKTCGAGEVWEMLHLYVSRNAALLDQQWLPVGWELWRGAPQLRSIFVGPPSEDLREVRPVEAKYSDGLAMGRALRALVTDEDGEGLMAQG